MNYTFLTKLKQCALCEIGKVKKIVANRCHQAKRGAAMLLHPKSTTTTGIIK